MDKVDHHFRADVAQQYGVDVAIFLHDLAYWVRYNKANDQNLHEGRYWMYNTMAAFCKIHLYWSRRQIERIIATCKEQELLLVDCFNSEKWDRTSWYTLSDKAMAFFFEEDTELAVSISPNREMDITKQGHPFPQTVSPIPYNIPDNKRIEPPYSPPPGNTTAKRRSKRIVTRDAPDWQPARFAAFWQVYPNGKSKQAAIRAWDKLQPSNALLVDMARGLQRDMSSPDWRREGGQYIPMASTWINNRRWEDEERHLAPATPSLQADGGQATTHVEGVGRFGWD